MKARLTPNVRTDLVRAPLADPGQSWKKVARLVPATRGPKGGRGPAAASGNTRGRVLSLGGDWQVEASDADVGDNFRAGSEEALREANRRWSRLVYSAALRSMGNTDHAAEITAEVFIEAWRVRTAYSPVAITLPGWLLTITRRRVMDRYETRSPGASSCAAQGPTSARTDGMAGDFDRVAATILVASELDRLAERARQVMRLAVYDNLIHRQIAERLDLPTIAVRSHLRESLCRLRATVTAGNAAL